MKVLFDHQCFTNQDYGGISRYFVSLMDEFNKQNDITTKLALKYSNNFYLKGKNNIKPFFPNLNFRGKKFSSHLTNLPFSISQIKKRDYNLFHPTYYNPYFLKYLGNKPFILTVHDMTHELFPDIIHWFDKTVSQKRFLARKAEIIIAISENTKKDLIEILNVPDKKIRIIHHGSTISKDLTGNVENLNLPKRYILYVGSRNYYKNFNNTIKSFSQLIKNDESLFLICGGGGKFTAKEIQFFKEANLTEKILYRPADDISLATLYSNARLFIFPSHYEGFGIPVLEAMNCDCPMALSNCSSLPEAGGDAAVYFDPHDPSDMSKQMTRVIYDENFRNKLIENGKIRRKNFSWEKTAIETKKVYEQIL
ncbi:MAG: glycosyltransferase family 1 protein [Ignavibacteriaceae bacterium]